jgi:hypothetical protein
LQTSDNQDDNYAQVLGYSYLFYEAQQTGQLPGWNRLLYGTSSSEFGTGWKKNAHLVDGADVQKDLSGGWYDAGGEGHNAAVFVTRLPLIRVFAPSCTLVFLTKLNF